MAKRSAFPHDYLGVPQFQPASRILTPVLDHIDLSMTGPGVWALLGPSGAGKSSLLRTTQRLIDRGPGSWCRSGQILFNGQEIHRPGLKRRALARSIGYIQQNPRVLGGSIRANVAFAAETHHPALAQGN